jgi:hypothetical protein
LRSAAGIGIDVSLAALPYEAAMIDRAFLTELAPERSLRLCSPEDLVIMKVFAGRETDLRDARSVVVRQGKDHLDWDWIETQIQELASLTDNPELLARLHRLRMTTD